MWYMYLFIYCIYYVFLFFEQLKVKNKKYLVVKSKSEVNV